MPEYTKAGQFLRTIGGSLSPQFAAQMRQEEQLAQQQAQFDLSREDDRKKMAADFLSIAIKNPNLTDEERAVAQQKLVELTGVDVPIAAPPNDKAKTHDVINLIHRGSSKITGYRKNDPKIDELLATGEYFKVGTSIQSPDATGLKNKDKSFIELDDARIAVEQNIKNIQPIYDLIKNENYIGGTTGEAVKAITSASSQFKQLMGMKQEIAEQDYTDKGVMARLQEAAKLNSLETSAVQELAFLHAKSLNADGKISDADVRAAMEILGTGATKESRLAVLQRMEDRLISNFNTFGKIKSERLGLSFTPVSRQSILGSGITSPSISNKVKTIATDIINSELRQ